MKCLRHVLFAVTVTTAFAGFGGAAHGEPKTIGIAVFGADITLEQVAEGFKAELGRRGFHEGKEVTFATSHANFNPAMLPQILTQLEARKPALLFTITTPVSQMAKSKLNDQSIPIVFGAVIDPVRAQIVPSWEHGSDRMVGASNMVNMEATFTFMRTLIPNLKTIGVPYNPGEVNDAANLALAEQAGKKLGIAIKPAPVNSLSDIAPRIHSLRGADAIYLMTSNLLMPAAPAVAAAADQIDVPVVLGAGPLVRQHVALAGYGVSYPHVGEAAARLAVEVLKGKKPSELANYRPTAADHVPVISAKQLARFKLELPDALKNCNCVAQ